MRQNQPASPLTTDKKKATEALKESCIILKKGERLWGGNKAYDDNKKEQDE